MAFFDEHRTGELVNRLTTDVQDFKSAFKQCVSQGLRSVTQTVGCVVSMYLVSPSLTLYMVIARQMALEHARCTSRPRWISEVASIDSLQAAVVPTVIGAGTLLGAMLRDQSRKAQAQVPTNRVAPPTETQ